jgi:hypothetical protein
MERFCCLSDAGMTALVACQISDEKNSNLGVIGSFQTEPVPDL